MKQEPLRIYKLLEHQSTSPIIMPFRLLQYKVNIWDGCLKEHPGRKLLPIVPVVLYHGKKQWTVPRNFSSLIDGDDQIKAMLRPFIPDFTYVLDDLGAITEEELLDRDLEALASAVLMSMRYLPRHPGEIPDLVDKIRPQLRALLGRNNGLADIRALGYYWFSKGQKGMEQVIDKIEQQLGQEAGEAMQTIADSLRAEGRALGEVGNAQEAIFTVLSARGLPINDGIHQKILRCQDMHELKQWLKNASCIDDISKLFG